MEIKRTVLAPYGGPRESMGSRSGGNAWSHGRGVIGSPADGVVVPDLLGLTASEALQALEDVGLIGLPETTTEGATAENDGQVSLQQPTAGTRVAPGTSVNYLVYNNAQSFFMSNGDFDPGQLEEATSNILPGRIYLIGPSINLQNAISHGSSWQIKVNNFSTTYPATAEYILIDNRFVIRPTAPMSAEFNATITGSYWNIDYITVSESTGIISINANPQS
jgi:hypothetical protein